MVDKQKTSILKNIVLFHQYGKYLFKWNRKKVAPSELILKRPYDQKKVGKVKKIVVISMVLIAIIMGVILEIDAHKEFLSTPLLKIGLVIINLAFLAFVTVVTGLEDIDFNDFYERMYYFRQAVWFWFTPCFMILSLFAIIVL